MNDAFEKLNKNQLKMHRKSGFYLFAKSLFSEKIVAKKPFLC